MAKPQRNTMATSQRDTMATPQRDTMATPQRNTMATPQKDTMATPQRPSNSSMNYDFPPDQFMGSSFVHFFPSYLCLTPSPRLNLHLEPAEFQVALKWWLGIPVVQGQSCPHCPSCVLDDFGHHSLTCKHEGDVVSRHNKLRDVLYDFCQRACLGPRLEMGCGAGSDSQSRPANVLVSNRDLGKPAAFDLSVTSTLQSSALLEASVTAGSAAQLAENRKHNNSDKKCDELGWVCIPLVVETYGGWGAEAVAALSKLAGRLSVRNNELKSKTIFSLYSRLGLTLVRANCRAILSRLT
eukprot:Em0006g845a